ncbi:hypothetical protein GALMADRAFT_148463 [Galerina marginata CBS 339.88]|uniref:Reverse transcriptase zinc-binding domain-containing protein n=1 Tax=Galerina marginata (strain CBS 339.88) TaxID=685588 RepID=A0A067S4G2_GALM3|nr:hypothetical protein GALMADRAFT_148463 [Galerina marginata CBS 339.88]
MAPHCCFIHALIYSTPLLASCHIGTPSESADDDEAVPKGDASASAIASMLETATKALTSGRANVADSISGSHRLTSGVVDFIAALHSAGWTDASTGAAHGFIGLSDAIMPFLQLPRGMDVDDQTICRPFQAASTSALFPPERTAPPDVPSPPDKKGKGNADHPKGGPKPLPQPRPAKVKEVVPFQRPPPPIPLHTKPGRSQKPVRTGYAAAAAKPAAPAAGPSKRPLTPLPPRRIPLLLRSRRGRLFDRLRSESDSRIALRWAQAVANRPQHLGRDFLQLTTLGKKPKPILPSTRKGGPYIRESGADAASFARMCRCILNHAPIGSYYDRFNIDEPHGCSQCGAPRETRSHILSYCPKYERNSPTDRLHGLLMFLLDNPQAFSFTRQAAAPQGIG